MNGFAIAFNEITLVLFTTLAPSGAVAYVLMNLPVLFGRVDGGQRRQLDKLSCLPLAIAMVGLIASATHLGNPSNALYAFAGVGRSPLSTEVFCAVIFLALAGVYWLYSFAEAPRRRLQRLLLVCIDVAAVCFVVATAYAYDVDTILTWSLPLVPVSLLLNALVGGPVIALFSFACAHVAAVPGAGAPARVARGASAAEGAVAKPASRAKAAPAAMGPAPRSAGVGQAVAEPAAAPPSWALGLRAVRCLLLVSVGALLANVAAYVAIAVQLAGLSNELVTAVQLVPGLPVCVAVFAALAAAGIAFAWRVCASWQRSGDLEGRARLARLGAAATLVLAGVFIMRFTFYMSHLTIGLGV